jgi:hypothetical protein
LKEDGQGELASTCADNAAKSNLTGFVEINCISIS